MSKKKKTFSDYLMLALMGLLVLGLGGFGIRNFSGGSSTIATVGDRDITAAAYHRAMAQAARAQQAAGASGTSLAALEEQGIPAQVRGQLIGFAAINNEADRIGLSVGDDEVAKVVTGIPSFHRTDGKFDRDAYEYTLKQNGWSVSEFEQNVRDESTRNILMQSVASGVMPPAPLIDLLTAWFGERRSFRWAEFGPESLTAALPAPTEAELEAYHTAHAADFTLPETKRITYAWLTPEMLIGDVQIDDAALRKLYDERAEQYQVPERRLVERLVFGTAEEATAARAAIEAGQTDFAKVVAERGLALEDVDLGEVTEADLGPAGEAVFALSEPGLAGPFTTDLGPALFRMNGILQAQETSFEEALPELRDELGRERARRTIEDLVNDMDDRLAGGATLEDLAEETAMELGTIDYYDGVDDGIAAYEGFRTAVATLGEGDFPEVLTLDDGSIYAMRLDEVVAPHLQPLAEVRDAVVAAWTADQTRQALLKEAEAAKTALDGGKTFEEAAGRAVQSADDATRGNFVEDLDAAVAEVVFKLKPGEAAAIPTADGAVLVMLNSVNLTDENDPQVALFRRAMMQQGAQTMASDLFVYYTQYLVSTTGISINDAGLNAVHSQLFR